MQLKICGIKTIASAKTALHFKPDFIGLIFVPSSPRKVTIKTAQKIIALAKKNQTKTVAVFQDQLLDEVLKILKIIQVDYVQLHGNESPRYCTQIPCKTIKAIRLENTLAATKKNIAKYKNIPDFFLIDRPKQGQGKIVDLRQVKDLVLDYHIFLAGGLNPDNIQSILKKTDQNLKGLDVSSGVETKPGIKNMTKLKKFISKIKPSLPTTKHFGPYGGRYVPEMLIPALEQLKKAYYQAKKDPEFQKKLTELYQTYSGRPTPLTFAANLTKKLNGAKIYLKNEGLNHTGAHKINHCLGQVLLAQITGKKRIIAETGAGQHGLATATVAAKFGLKCTIYMGEIDIARQRPNVFYMERLGAEVVPVKTGAKTLKDAVNAAIKDWMTNSDTTHYVIGSALGPDPYPEMNRDFQSIIGQEVKKQIKKAEKKLPDILIACVGGGSNAIGLFHPFLKNQKVQMIGVEAGGAGRKPGQNAARFQGGKVGVVEGYKSYFLQTKDGQIAPTHSISAGLDYAGIGPELAYLHDTKRIAFTSATDQEVLAAFDLLAKTEGIFPALESAHAVAEAIKLAPKLAKNKIIVINISGRGDKDLFILAKAFQDKSFKDFLKNEIK